MQQSKTALLTHIATWSAAAQDAAGTCRALFHGISERADIGPLDESLKWGQPAWRPIKPRTGSTLRMSWSQGAPSELAFFVDCKTDLAARMQSMYPDLPGNDGQRRIAIDLNAPLPEAALSHLAEMTFCYHLSKRKSA